MRCIEGKSIPEIAEQLKAEPLPHLRKKTIGAACTPQEDHISLFAYFLLADKTACWKAPRCCWLQYITVHCAQDIKRRKNTLHLFIALSRELLDHC